MLFVGTGYSRLAVGRLDRMAHISTFCTWAAWFNCGAHGYCVQQKELSLVISERLNGIDFLLEDGHRATYDLTGQALKDRVRPICREMLVRVASGQPADESWLHDALSAASLSLRCRHREARSMYSVEFQPYLALARQCLSEIWRPPSKN